mgnify:FL=1
MKQILKIIIIILIIIPVFFFSIVLFDSGTIEYEETINIEASTNTLDAFIGDIYNMKKYMDGDFDIVLIEGEHTKANAIYNIIWKMDSDSMTMQATLLNNNLPDSISYIYESNGVKNTMTQKHHPISNNQTLIINKQKFEFYGLMKILTFLKVKGFKLSDFQNQSRIYLKEFKSFIENESIYDITVES